jgi:Pretoxin HINT domain
MSFMPTNAQSRHPAPLRRRGQGNTEVILVLVLLAGAIFGTLKVFGDQQRDLYGRSAIALAGEDSATEAISCPDGLCRVPWGNCFIAGTKVLTANGLRNIEEVRRGDLVYSRNTDSGEVGWKSVAETFVTPDRPVMTLELVSIDGTARQSVVVTPQHPFWVVDAGWKQAEALSEGVLVATANGSLRVDHVRAPTANATVYNFEVSDWHTYFVSESAVLVHNPCNDKPAAGTTDGTGVASEPSARERLQRAYDRERTPRGDSFLTRSQDVAEEGNSTSKTNFETPFGLVNLNKPFFKGDKGFMVTTKKEAYGGQSVGHKYNQLIDALLKDHSGNEAEVASDLLAAIETPTADLKPFSAINTQLEKNAAAKFIAITQISEEQRFGGSAKWARAALRTIAAGKATFNDLFVGARPTFLMAATGGGAKTRGWLDRGNGSKTPGSDPAHTDCVLGNMSDSSCDEASDSESEGSGEPPAKRPRTE